MLDHPDTAAAVYNTLTIPDAPAPTTQEADMDDATTARAAELQQHETEIGLQLRDHRNPLDPDSWQSRYDEMNDIRRQRRALEQLLSDEEWHHRAANSGERFSVILADLVAPALARLPLPHRLAATPGPDGRSLPRRRPPRPRPPARHPHRQRRTRQKQRPHPAHRPLARTQGGQT